MFYGSGSSPEPEPQNFDYFKCIADEKAEVNNDHIKSEDKSVASPKTKERLVEINLANQKGDSQPNFISSRLQAT